MTPHEMSALRAAVAGLNDGDIETFVGLMSDDMVWSGFPRGWLWWRKQD